MSKAFTRESDESDADEFQSIRPQLPPGARNYITHRGADRLKERLNELIEKKRAWSATSGEAGAATVADQKKIDSAIRKLQALLNTIVVAEIPANREKVAFGAVVSIRRVNGDEEEFQIVGVEEADPNKGLISWISPLARALLSRKAGETVRFDLPARTEELTVLKVHYDMK